MQRALKVSSIITAVAIAGIILASGCGGKKANSDFLATFEWPEKQHIKLEDLEKEISELPEYKRQQYQDEKGRNDYLTLMAESRMLLSVAQKKGLDKDPDIDKKVDDYLNQTLVERLTESEVDEKALASTTDLDLQKYYDEHMTDYIEPEKVRLTAITLTDEGKIEDIQSRIENGEDIAQIAKELSDKGENVGPGGGKAGDSGYFSREDYGSNAPEFVKTVFALEKGQISDIVEQEIRNSVYYMICRLEDRQAQRQRTFDEVKEEVRREVESEKKEARRKEWLESLRSKAKMQTFPERIPATDPKPPEEEKTDE